MSYCSQCAEKDREIERLNNLLKMVTSADPCEKCGSRVSFDCYGCIAKRAVEERDAKAALLEEMREALKNCSYLAKKFMEKDAGFPGRTFYTIWELCDKALSLPLPAPDALEKVKEEARRETLEEAANICKIEGEARQKRYENPLPGDMPEIQAHKGTTAFKLEEEIRSLSAKPRGMV